MFADLSLWVMRHAARAAINQFAPPRMLHAQDGCFTTAESEGSPCDRALQWPHNQQGVSDKGQLKGYYADSPLFYKT